jgi:hypothetical protein
MFGLTSRLNVLTSIISNEAENEWVLRITIGGHEFDAECADLASAEAKRAQLVAYLKAFGFGEIAPEGAS